jgi:hypothetical protein
MVSLEEEGSEEGKPEEDKLGEDKLEEEPLEEQSEEVHERGNFPFRPLRFVVSPSRYVENGRMLAEDSQWDVIAEDREVDIQQVWGYLGEEPDSRHR